MAERRLAVRHAERAAEVLVRSAKGALRDQQVRRATLTRYQEVAKIFFVWMTCHLRCTPSLVVGFDRALMSWAG